MISLDLRRKHKTGKKGLRHRTKLIREQKSETPEVSNLFEAKIDLMTHVLELKAQNPQMVLLQPVLEDHSLYNETPKPFGEDNQSLITSLTH